MATFHYGPYAWVSENGVPPGTEHAWTFGPWDWYADAVTITCHPISRSGFNRAMRVMSVTARTTAGGERFIDCVVRNTGPDPANYAIWIGGVSS